MLERLRRSARILKREALTIYLAYRDPRVPLYARLFALLVATYAFSPIDLIPDFIPVLGYLDDLLIVPLGVWLALRLIPVEVRVECRAKAAQMAEKPVSRAGMVFIVGVWLVVLALIVSLVIRAANDG